MPVTTVLKSVVQPRSDQRPYRVTYRPPVVESLSCLAPPRQTGAGRSLTPHNMSPNLLFPNPNPNPVQHCMDALLFYALFYLLLR